MMKATIALCLIVSLFAIVASVPFSSASPVALVSIDPPTTQLSTANVGQTFQVNVTVTNVQNLWAWDLERITFDPNVLTLVNVQEGPFLQKAGQTIFMYAPSVTLSATGIIPAVQCALLSHDTASGSGVIATLIFSVASSGSSLITLNRTELDDNYQYLTPQGDPSGVFEVINSTVTSGIVNIGNVVATPIPTSTIPSSSPLISDTIKGSPSLAPTAPEFPTWFLMPLVLIIPTIALILIKKKPFAHN